MPAERQSVIEAFHRLYYYEKAQTWGDTTWHGVPLLKCPLDLWVYQELLWRIRPRWIIETGTYAGGSALFLAHMCDLLGAGEVLTIDIARPPQAPQHERLHYVTGSSIDPAVLACVRGHVGQAGPVLVILDSDHHCPHVLAELHAYAPLVTPGSYLIVEDTNLNGHPVAPEFGPGPAEAVASFLAQNASFEADPQCEKYLITANGGGYLRRRVLTP